MVYATLHVIGAIVASLCFGIFVLVVANWDGERTKKRRLRDTALALGVSVATLENDTTLLPRFIEYTSQRYSSELLRNRLSDLCGFVLLVWNWLSAALQAVIVVAVGWTMYTSGATNAVYMWSVLAVAVVSWFVGIAFSLACLLLTGRYAGEARTARKALASFIEERSARAAEEGERVVMAAP